MIFLKYGWNFFISDVENGTLLQKDDKSEIEYSK
jgi:hypothetical protein